MRRLVINADDLGLVASVNRGIVETIEAGVVRSASLMVNMPGFGDAIARLATLRDTPRKPGIGLHFNIVAGVPLSECASLVNRETGRFALLTSLAAKSFLRRVEPRDVQRELDAQLGAARDALGAIGYRLTHIDSHRHAHCLPTIFDVVTRTATRLSIPHVRRPRESVGGAARRPRAILAAMLLRLVSGGHAPYDDVGFSGFGMMASRTFEADLTALLETLPSGTTELMVHPGYDSAELGHLDPYRKAREREVRALVSSAIRERLAALGIELSRFGE